MYHTPIVSYSFFLWVWLYAYVSIKTNLTAGPELDHRGEGPVFQFRTRQSHPDESINSLIPHLVWLKSSGELDLLDTVAEEKRSRNINATPMQSACIYFYQQPYTIPIRHEKKLLENRFWSIYSSCSDVHGGSTHFTLITSLGFQAPCTYYLLSPFSSCSDTAFSCCCNCQQITEPLMKR